MVMVVLIPMVMRCVQQADAYSLLTVLDRGILMETVSTTNHLIRTGGASNGLLESMQPIMGMTAHTTTAMRHARTLDAFNPLTVWDNGEALVNASIPWPVELMRDARHTKR